MIKATAKKTTWVSVLFPFYLRYLLMYACGVYVYVCVFMFACIQVLQSNFISEEVLHKPYMFTSLIFPPPSSLSIYPPPPISLSSSPPPLSLFHPSLTPLLHLSISPSHPHFQSSLIRCHSSPDLYIWFRSSPKGIQFSSHGDALLIHLVGSSGSPLMLLSNLLSSFFGVLSFT